MMTVTLCTGTFAVAGEILVAPHLGAVGVAWVTVIAAIMQNALQLALVKHYVHVWSQMQFSPRALRRFFVRRKPQPTDGSPAP
jgi:hypothetical protein